MQKLNAVNPVKCKDCKNLLDVPCNPYPVCDYFRTSKHGSLKPINKDEARDCRFFKGSV